ncbi:serine hydrolase domain-containing protein [Lysobacter sp. FW306-1B-D06B]|uniref:serine hydrolase domain-containing protein n=1 Tax=Lysobacter sp. FW306-1B-D06B TaxID=3140250 RepID=UPI003140105D
MAFATLLCIPLAGGAQTVTDAALHKAMTDLLAAQGLQGAVWSTVADDGAIAVDAAGTRDARTGAALHPQDQVHVGSVAKTVLATGVLRLVSQRRLSLDAPVSELLPGVAFDNPWASDSPVRVRHLLDHTAGLDDARLADMFSLKARADAPLSTFLDGRTLRVRSRPGSRHSYSNTGYTLLGMVIEAVTGARYDAWLDANLLRPLRMHDSTFAFTTQEGAGANSRVAMGHFENGVAHAAVPMFLRPAGQFTTTAEDMGRFARFLMSDGRIDGTAFIDPTLLRAMGQPQGTEAARAGLRVGYGLGMATRDRHGAVGKCHGGSTVGYRAMLCVFPQHQRAFFIALNTDHETADYGRFDRLLIESLGLPMAEALPRMGEAGDAMEGYYIPSPNRFARFEWLDATLGFVRITREGEGVRFAPLQSSALMLTPVGGNLLRADDRALASHAFVTTADSTRAITTGLQTYERVALPVIAARWISLAAGLLGVAWLLVMGAVRFVLDGRDRWKRSAVIPFLGIAVLLLPVPLFLRQSFLQLGDLTPASGTLAAVTALLPLTMVLGLIFGLRRRPWSALDIVDVVAMVAVLQLTVVLAFGGLLPLRLWA